MPSSVIVAIERPPGKGNALRTGMETRQATSSCRLMRTAPKIRGDQRFCRRFTGRHGLRQRIAILSKAANSCGHAAAASVG